MNNRDENNVEVCRKCKGRGSDDFYDIEDYYPCPACEGTGKVEKGTKTWFENLLSESNDKKI